MSVVLLSNLPGKLLNYACIERSNICINHEPTVYAQSTQEEQEQKEEKKTKKLPLLMDRMIRMNVTEWK